MKKVLAFIASILLVCAVTGCQKKQHVKSEKIEVFTTIYPLQYFTERIGGDCVKVTNIVPPGVEPHDFELTIRERASISKGDLFVYNGAGLEKFSEDLADSLDKNKTLVVNTSQGLSLLSRSETTQKGHEHLKVDPHIWLDPIIAKDQAQQIKTALIEKDKEHKSIYESNFRLLANDLDALHQEYVEMANSVQKREFIVSHAAFSYLAKRYDLKQMALSGLSPLEEPSPKDLREAIKLAKVVNTKYVFFEPLTSSRVLDTLRKEIGAEALILNPLEGLTSENIKAKDNYLTIMRQNKNNLRKALEVISD